MYIPPKSLSGDSALNHWEHRIQLRKKTRKMREKAEISPVQKERLESIQWLLDRADALTKI